MARKVVTETYSDLSGEAGASRLTFALQGDAFSIDLTGTETKALRDALAPYIAAATKVKSARSAGGRRERDSGV